MRAARAWDPVAELAWRAHRLRRRAWRRVRPLILGGRAALGWRLGALGAALRRGTRTVLSAPARAMLRSATTPARQLPDLRAWWGKLRWPRRTRRISVAVAAVTILVAALATWTWQAFRDDTGPERASPVAGVRGPPGADPAAPPQGASEGPGLTRTGIHLSVSPDSLGDLDVVERIIAARPVGALSLSPPPRVPGEAGRTNARLVDVQVTADSTPVDVADDDVEQAGDVELPRPATVFELRYRVVGADLRSESAPPGRATLSLRPAAFADLASAPTVVQVQGAVVHTLVCVDLPRARQLCGVEDLEGWHTEQVAAATSRVLALVDLPGPHAA